MLTGGGIKGPDFFADGRVLFLVPGLTMVLHAAVQVHLPGVTRFDRTGTAAGHYEQQQTENQVQKGLHGTKVKGESRQ